MVYPSAVLVVFTAVLAVLLGWVIPSFKTIFKDLGASDELPYLTQLVIAASETFIGYLPFFLLGGIGLSIATVYFYRTPRGKKLFHRIMLRMPVMGPVLRKIAVARFTRTLGTLLSSGVPILDAMDIVAKTAGNVVVEEAILYARAKISEGKNMAALSWRPTSSRRWSSRWSASVSRPAPSTRCSARSPTFTRKKSTSPSRQ